MIVYHSSYMIVDKPDVLHSREALDFGKGFYVTVLHEQAVRYAERFKLRGRKAYLNVFELNDEWRKENIKVFDSYNEEWLDFIAANRKLMPVEHFDAVEGGIRFASSTNDSSINISPISERRNYNGCQTEYFASQVCPYYQRHSR